MHVDDLGDAVVFALEKWDPKASNAPLDENGTPISFLNIGTGVDISIKELAEKISNKVNYMGKIRWDKTKPDGTPKKLLDVSRINELGWKANISLDKGIEETLKIFEKNNN